MQTAVANRYLVLFLQDAAVILAVSVSAQSHIACHILRTVNMEPLIIIVAPDNNDKSLLMNCLQKMGQFMRMAYIISVSVVKRTKG